MRLFGRIEPGNGGGVFTGQPGCFSPFRMASTSEKLSRCVRNLACVVRGSACAESDASDADSGPDLAGAARVSAVSPSESPVPLARADESPGALHAAASVARTRIGTTFTPV